MTGMRLMPAGDRALLVAPDAHDALPGVVLALRRADLEEVEDLLPAAETVLVTLRPGANPAVVAGRLRSVLTALPDAPPTTVDDSGQVLIPVRYNGEDLAEVADQLGISVEEVVTRHTGGDWRCRFIGFTAGFGYLESADADLAVPRRHQSRTVVPAGAVALADGYTAVYPRRAPGGWQIIGTTDVAMWDLGRPRPALLSPGVRVRFVQEGGR